VVGPDFVFSIVEMCLVNGVIAMVLKSALAEQTMNIFWIGVAILAFHDVAFLGTVMTN
jgi:predicted membrane-bound dolichyl-phosphate-mannose-protein mannosyltransferase